ncbi:MAG: rRNA maturation RNase YbeY [Planctomycetota bacterium]
MPDPPTTPPPAAADDPEPSPGESPSDSPRLHPGPPPPPEALSPPEVPVDPALPPDPAAAVRFHLDTHDADPPAAGWIESYLERALRRVGITTGGLELTLVDDATMAALHAEHCGDPSTTDVLTFDLAPPDAPDHHLEGDLVLCRPEADRQARARGHDTRTELLLYAVHGLMHLLGEDDHDPDGYRRMHQREDRLLTDLGLGAVFARPERPAVSSPSLGAPR